MRKDNSTDPVCFFYSDNIYICRDISFPKEAHHLTHVHILDLHKDGVIKPHIDSIRVSSILHVFRKSSVLWRCNQRCFTSFRLCHEAKA